MSRLRALLLVALLLVAAAVVAIASANTQYLPIVRLDPTPTPTNTPIPTNTPVATNTPTPTRTPTPDPNRMTEVRGLWVTRFDWTTFNQPAQPARLDEIVDDAAFAGFNVIYFQVRGTADAYYDSDLEPWAQRVSGQNLGQWPYPYWDPLAYLIEKAHARGIEVHAYLNVYPLGDCNTLPGSGVWPRPVYHQLIDRYGTTLVNGVVFNDGLQTAQNASTQCQSDYLRASPASIFYDNHLIAVARDIVSRYDVDGLHLDHIRYGGRTSSCDPVSLCRYNGQDENCSPVPQCSITANYQDWQRRQINGTVQKFYNQVVLEHPDIWLSAAVWPIHTNKWGWAASQGYSDYYQDSKAWVQGGYIDSISPMIYANTTACPEDGTFWTQAVWETLVRDFQAERGSRYIVPGIGTTFCNFQEITWRIQKAREIGTAGHALFSYSYLKQRQYLDDLRNGPYRIPADVPAITWRP